MSWSELEAGAAEIARLGRERIDATGVAMLGTIRADGSPRISPVEPFVVPGQLLFGAMARSAKARDLGRDARCTLHSVVTAPNAGQGELKLFGRAVEVRDPLLRGAADHAWWVSYPEEDARVLSFAVERAVYVSWDLEGGLMTIARWSPERGSSVATRAYP